MPGNIGDRIEKIKYQLIKNLSILIPLTDEQKIEAAQSIYDAAINLGGDVIDETKLPTTIFGTVGITWGAGGNSATFISGDKILVDDFRDDIVPTLPGGDTTPPAIVKIRKITATSSNGDSWDLSTAAVIREDFPMMGYSNFNISLRSGSELSLEIRGGSDQTLATGSSLSGDYSSMFYNNNVDCNFNAWSTHDVVGTINYLDSDYIDLQMSFVGSSYDSLNSTTTQDTFTVRIQSPYPIEEQVPAVNKTQHINLSSTTLGTVTLAPQIATRGGGVNRGSPFESISIASTDINYAFEFSAGTFDTFETGAMINEFISSIVYQDTSIDYQFIASMRPVTGTYTYIDSGFVHIVATAIGTWDSIITPGNPQDETIEIDIQINYTV